MTINFTVLSTIYLQFYWIVIDNEIIGGGGGVENIFINIICISIKFFKFFKNGNNNCN